MTLNDGCDGAFAAMPTTAATRRPRGRWLAVGLAATLLLAACSSSGSDEAPPTTQAAPANDDTGDASTDADSAAGGGTLVLAVEQWPECLNPVTSCSNASWALWSTLIHVLPRLMELDTDNKYVASSLLTEEPTVDNGGLVIDDDGTFTLTYRLNPDAQWSDGTPITSTDVWFSWRAALDTTGTLSTLGADQITGIDHSDPHTAVVTFEEAYAPWQTLFGGLLPAHELGPDTDIADKWNDEITVSGGPWIQQSWSAEQQILVPNRNYWDAERIPLVDQVVMVPREDTDSEILALQTGEVMAAFPQPFPGARERITGDLTYAVGEGVYMEGLWINQDAPDRRFEITRNVRQALAYALDREQIADVALRVDHPRSSGAAMRRLEPRLRRLVRARPSPATSRTLPRLPSCSRPRAGPVPTPTACGSTPRARSWCSPGTPWPATSAARTCRRWWPR